MGDSTGGSRRIPIASDARWLRSLASDGYTLAEVEQQIVARPELHPLPRHRA